MQSATVIRGLALLLMLLNAGCEREVSQPAEEFQPRWHFLAAGDPEDGRRAFVDLKCHACHTVSGYQLDGVTNAAPELGSMVAGLSADDIAVSIIAPSHAASSKRGLWRNETPVQMGDYSREMTVRQLMDIVSYLRAPRSRDHEKQSKN